jgi:hypothetical protein
MAEPVVAPEPDVVAEPEPVPEPEPTSGQTPTGVNDEAAFRRIIAERDSLRAELAEAKSADDVEAAKKAATEEVQALYDAKMLDFGIEMALIKAGCINTRAARALIETDGLSLEGEAVRGLDAAKLARDYPYLFSAVPKVSTGASPAGAGSLSAEDRQTHVMGKMNPKKG